MPSLASGTRSRTDSPSAAATLGKAGLTAEALDLRRQAAPAKINLALHVLGRREDGYHDLDTMVVFADVGDVVAAEPFPGDLDVAVDGPFAGALATSDPTARNLVVRAARALGVATGRDRAGLQVRLTKNLPVAAGLGGGSADAAAVLRLLGPDWNRDDRSGKLGAIALSLGADVPMCLLSKPLLARGRGEDLRPLAGMPPLAVVLVYPGVPVSTAEVFALRSGPFDPLLPPVPPSFASAAEVVRWLRGTRNGLADAAMQKAPAIRNALEALAGAPAAMLSRMSGSGSSCFGIFPSREAAQKAARTIRAAEPSWWVMATTTGGS